MTFDKSKIQYLIGSKNNKSDISEPFSDVNLEFLNELSLNIFKHKHSKKYKDLIAFAFWCRKKNIIKIKNNFLDKQFRLGLGIIFHLTPSNVPIAFMYSFIFGLLSGNSNIVRVSKPDLEQVKLLFSIIKKIFRIRKFEKLSQNNSFIYYDKDTNISDYFSSFVDGRVVWGNDKTIGDFKKMTTKSKCVDLFFGDKYSISLFSSKKLKKLNKIEFSNLIKNFYNDVFIMDQNACTSPHLIIWEKKPLKSIIEIFWNNLEKFVQDNYLTSLSITSKKYQILNNYLMENSDLRINKMNNKYIKRIKINKLDKNIINYRGFSGLFFEYEMKDILELNEIINRNFQTLSYFGYDKIFFEKIFKRNKFKGIDRIVPVGETLEMSLIWDGINVVNHLSRIVSIK